MIEVQTDADTQLTTFTCTGVVAPSEIEHEIREFYQGATTLNTIWDFTGADLTKLTADAISGIAKFIKNAAHSREGGRTALLFTRNDLLTMGDRFSSLAQIEVKQARIKIFDSMEKARGFIAD